jgi:hypothetical protein
MKFSKDQQQKIFLSGLLMAGLIYCYFTFLISPASQADTANGDKIAELDKKLADAQTAILRSRNIAQQARSAEETLAQVNDLIPEGSAIAWFPPRMRAYFDRQNLKDSVVRPVGEATNEPAMGDLKSRKWTIDIPQSGFNQLGIALAGLENDEKLLEITSLQINAQPENPEKQHVAMTVVTLIK